MGVEIPLARGKGGARVATKKKETRIADVQDKLRRLCDGLPEKKRVVALPLVDQAAFMQVTLEDLQKEINQGGCTEEYQNGKNQTGNKATASLQAYNSMVKNFAGVCERLDRILPDAPIGGKLAELMRDD